uniref:Secreted protein n=1 Tax=Macaca mulatta TaxID=9544 RepID=A0A5F7ZVQ5_MACMU
MISTHCSLLLLGLSYFPASASQVAGIIGVRQCTRLIFVFLVEMGFHHVGQAGLELLISTDLPASVSQSAGMTGMSHCAQPVTSSFEHVPRWFQVGQHRIGQCRSHDAAHGMGQRSSLHSWWKELQSHSAKRGDEGRVEERGNNSLHVSSSAK